jgi:hypothetical protein
MGLRMRMDWHRDRSICQSIISDRAEGTVNENEDSCVTENKMSVPAE